MRQRRPEIAQVALAQPGTPCCNERLDPLIGRHGNEQRHRTTAVGDLERFTGGHTAQPAARVLAKLAYPDPVHVLHSSTKRGLEHCLEGGSELLEIFGTVVRRDRDPKQGLSVPVLDRYLDPELIEEAARDHLGIARR